MNDLTAEAKPLISIQDDMFAISVTQARRAAAFAGEPAAPEKQFFVLAFTVVNQGKTGEFFQPGEQLFLLDADAREIAPDEITHRGVHRPEAQIHLPAGARRSFEVVYVLDATTKAPQLSFHGGSFMQAYDVAWSP